MANEGFSFRQGHPLFSAGMKIDRARAHTRTIISSTSPLSKNSYFMGWHPTDNSSPTLVRIHTASGSESEMYDFSFVPKMPIAATLGGVIGDALHCLRSSLDHAVTSAAHFAGKERKFFYFPFDESEQQFVSSGRTKLLFGVFGEQETLEYMLGDVKPFKEGNFDLWSLNKADNEDKHNLIIPAVTIANVALSVPFLAGKHMVGNLGMGNPIDHPFTVLSLPKEEISNLRTEATLTVDCRFPTEWFGGAPVVEKLDSLIDNVSAQLSSFHRFASRRLPGWPKSAD